MEFASPEHQAKVEKLADELFKLSPEAKVIIKVKLGEQSVIVHRKPEEAG